jgi:hypothetical protein
MIYPPMLSSATAVAAHIELGDNRPASTAVEAVGPAWWHLALMLKDDEDEDDSPILQMFDMFAGSRDEMYNVHALSAQNRQPWRSVE